MPFTYILKSLKIENWYYVGSCDSLLNRLKQHRKGSVRSAKFKRPLKLIYRKEFETIREAKEYKNYLKSPMGYLEKKKIIENYNKEKDR
jgi:predicted GIY-YIG superfamily endonuclease